MTTRDDIGTLKHFLSEIESLGGRLPACCLKGNAHDDVEDALDYLRDQVDYAIIGLEDLQRDIELAHEEEEKLYEKRMRGDWS